MSSEILYSLKQILGVEFFQFWLSAHVTNDKYFGVENENLIIFTINSYLCTLLQRYNNIIFLKYDMTLYKENISQ